VINESSEAKSPEVGQKKKKRRKKMAPVEPLRGLL